MTQLQFTSAVASGEQLSDYEACQQTLARALRCQMILRSVHGQRDTMSTSANGIARRLAELDRQIEDARRRLAAFDRWH